MSVNDPNWKYTDSANTEGVNRSNYLKEKWDREFPGWNRKPQRVDAPKIILPDTAKTS